MPSPVSWEIGARLPCGEQTVPLESMIAFAQELDPQPMHLDAGSPQAGMMGGLISSGWQTVAINHAMARKALLDGAGWTRLLRVDGLRWSTPVRPGDTLCAMAEILSLEPGALVLRHTLTNPRNETVMSLDACYGRDHTEPAAPDGGPYLPGDRPVHPVPFDKVTPGTVLFAGEHVFSAEAAGRYHALYDPAGTADTVAPWHITAQWLRLNVDAWAALEARGVTLPQRGPGLGLQHVIWPTPARVGEPLRYFSRTVSTRASSSRAGWGIITNRNYALNAEGAVVMAFTSSALLEGTAP